MALAIIGTILILGAMGCVGATGEYPAWLAIGGASTTVLSMIGIGVATAGNKKVGGYLIIAGSALHIPLGLIAAFGGKKLIDQAKEEAFMNSDGEKSSIDDTGEV